MRKIMFSDMHGLTAAVLAGTKTQTRRIVPQSVIDELYYAGFDRDFTDNLKQIIIKNKSRYKVGEVVAVAQSYKSINFSHDDLARVAFCENEAGWNNKMFVKAELMPHKIEITKIRVERLQDISDEDCISEGITTKIEGKFEVGNGYGWDTTIERLKRDTFLTPRAAYAALIDKISGNGTWALNPWTFVYNFNFLKGEEMKKNFNPNKMMSTLF